MNCNYDAIFQEHVAMKVFMVLSASTLINLLRQLCSNITAFIRYEKSIYITCQAKLEKMDHAVACHPDIWNPQFGYFVEVQINFIYLYLESK